MSAPKYHVNAAGKTVRCLATVRACRYSEPTTTAAGNQSAGEFLDSLDKEFPKPVTTIVEKSPLKQPREHLMDVGFEFDNPYYPGDEPNNSITAINIRQLLANAHHVWDTNLITDDYVQHATEAGWDDFGNFIVSRYITYYDEVETDIQMKPELLAEIESYYWNQPGADDAEGVLEYCRGKGFATTGLSPVEAVKSQLKAENNGKKYARVDNTTSVRKANLDINRVRIPAPLHYAEVEPAPLIPPTQGGQKIAGVVVEGPAGVFNLVDGYHRLKTLNNANRKTANYIILS